MACPTVTIGLVSVQVLLKSYFPTGTEFGKSKEQNACKNSKKDRFPANKFGSFMMEFNQKIYIFLYLYEI